MGGKGKVGEKCFFGDVGTLRKVNEFGDLGRRQKERWSNKESGTEGVIVKAIGRGCNSYNFE